MRKYRFKIIGIISLTFLLAATAGFLSVSTKAANINNTSYKCFTRYEIQKGDTLWSIAKEYITDEYDSIYEYIKEMKMTNNLKNDEIHIGSYLLIPYYLPNQT